MISNRIPVFVSLLALAACEAPPPPESDRQEVAAAIAEDRTIWDGLPEAGASGPATTPAVHPARLRTARPVGRSVKARPALISGLHFVDEPLDEALKRLQVVTGAPILITPQGRNVIAGQDVKVDFQLTSPLRLETVLDLLVGESPDLGWKVDDGVIWITTKGDARGPMQLRTYDVRDLLMARTNFPAPRIQGLPTGEEPYGYQQEEETTTAMDPDMLVDLIKNATDPAYWEETEGASIEVTETGLLLVRADAQMLGRIGLTKVW